MIHFVNLKNDTFIYFLGLYWADGWSKVNAISCKYDDILHLKKWIESYGFIIKNTQRSKNGKPWGSPQAIVHFYKSDFNKSFLKENGFNEKSQMAPSIILSKIPKNKHFLFWRGYFDGDGHIQIPTKTRNKKEVAFWGSIEQDWSEITRLLESLDIKYTKREYRRKCGNSSCVAFYQHDDIRKFGEYIYKNYAADKIGLERKWQRFDMLKKMERREKTSSSIGVCFNKGNNKWKSYLLKSETGVAVLFLGWFSTQQDAVEARNNKIKEMTIPSKR